MSLGDLDGDGDLDAFVANKGANRVWLNDGTGTFTDSGQSLGNYNSYGVALGDLDGDGDLDAFVTNSLNQPNRVWINQGGAQGGTAGVFADSGQTLGDHYSYGVALGDLDGDGDLDAFVTNGVVRYDFGANRVWINQGGAQNGTAGVFADSGQTLGDHDSKGVSLGDLDGDGDLDAFVVNWFEPNRVWLNQGGAQGGMAGVFADSGQTLGGANNPRWHLALGDLDGDGDLDAFVANVEQPNRVWLNQNPDLSITKTSNQVAVTEGDPLSYTIVVTNNGPGSVADATVTDTFPDTLTNVQWTAEITGTGNANLSARITLVNRSTSMPVRGSPTR